MAALAGWFSVRPVPSPYVAIPALGLNLTLVSGCNWFISFGVSAAVNSRLQMKCLTKPRVVKVK
jgi:hypothetical protein